MTQSWQPGDLPPAGAEHYRAWPPVGPGARAPRSGRRTLTVVAAIMAGSLALAGLCAAGLVRTVRSTDPDLSRIIAPSAPPQAQPSPFSGVYQAPTQLCTQANFTGMRRTLPVFTNLFSSRTTGPAGESISSCEAEAGNGSEEGDFRLTASVYPDPDAARAVFAASGGDEPIPYQVNASGAFATVQTSAFRGDGGSGARVYDGNLILEATWRPKDSATLDAAAVEKTLTSVCLSTLVLLRFS